MAVFAYGEGGVSDQRDLFGSVFVDAGTYSSSTITLTIVGPSVSFSVDGDPKPQGSKRAFVNPKNGRAIIVEDNKLVRPWRERVLWAARDACETPLDGPIAITLAFRMPRPKSLPKRRAMLPAKRPDLDKLTRAVFDALTGIAYHDDAQVCRVTATKVYATRDGRPGVDIEIARMA